MRRFIAGMVCGAALLYVAMHYHVVRGKEGIFLVPKISNDLSDTYVDTRAFSLDDWKQHKTLAAAIMQANRTELLDGDTLGSFREKTRALVDGLFGRTEDG